jgi:hypothetical protein
LLTSAGFSKSLRPLGPFTHQSGFEYNLRLSFLKLVQVLNGACTYQGRGVYDMDGHELARAFRLASQHLEWALAQHVASKRRRALGEDLAISSMLDLLSLLSSSQQTEYAARPRFSQARMAPAPSSAYPQSPPFTPSQSPTAAATRLLPRAATRSPSPAASRFGVSPSPRAASSSRYRSAPFCKKCKETGHSSPSCLMTKCWNCKYPRTEHGAVILLFYFTTITPGQRELTLCAFRNI